MQCYYVYLNYMYRNPYFPSSRTSIGFSEKSSSTSITDVMYGSVSSTKKLCAEIFEVEFIPSGILNL